MVRILFPTSLAASYIICCGVNWWCEQWTGSELGSLCNNPQSIIRFFSSLTESDWWRPAVGHWAIWEFPPPGVCETKCVWPGSADDPTVTIVISECILVLLCRMHCWADYTIMHDYAVGSSPNFHTFLLSKADNGSIMLILFSGCFMT